MIVKVMLEDVGAKENGGKMNIILEIPFYD
jgi:hypothetical protein